MEPECYIKKFNLKDSNVITKNKKKTEKKKNLFFFVLTVTLNSVRRTTI